VLHFAQDGDTEKPVALGTPGALGRTFVPARIADNPHIDAAYAGGLDMLDLVTRSQLKDGNWLIKPGRGMYFKAHWLPIVDAVPVGAVERIRYWDRAGTGETEAAKRKSSDPDWTVGLRLAKHAGLYTVEDIVRFRGTPGEVEATIARTARADGPAVQVGLEQDPGQAGKFEVDTYVRKLDGFNVRAYPARQDKITRAQPVSAQAEHGNVRLLRGLWNKSFLEELEAFPEGAHDDQVDALSGAHNALRNVVLNTPPSKFTRESRIAGDTGF
jgi:predicted phage terminase large subunit-like protein